MHLIIPLSQQQPLQLEYTEGRSELIAKKFD